MKIIHKFIIVLYLTAISFLAGCTTLKPYMQRDSVQFGPKEIEITADNMVIAIYHFIETIWKKAARIQVKNLRNNTSENIDTDLITEQILTELSKKKIEFIERKYLTNVISIYNQTGRIYLEHDDVPLGKLKSPNLYLAGNIRENIRTVNGRRMQYLLITLKLYNLETSIIEWQAQQEFYKITEIIKKKD